MTYDFESQRVAWSAPPVDDIGYVPSTQLMGYPDDQLRATIDRMRETRYTGWRNHGGLWRDVFGLDSTTGKYVLDFGCGVGMEAAEYARAPGNRVDLADISRDNLRLAARVVRMYSERVPIEYTVIGEPPYFEVARLYDVFHCSGVLHHIPHARGIMERAWDVLRPGGEVRLMVYSDRGWRAYTGTEPPEDVTVHPAFHTFVRTFDAVGEYADWYDREKIERLFGDLFEVTRFEYLTPNDRYLGAVLRRRERRP